MPMTPEEIEALAAEMLKQQAAAAEEETPAPAAPAAPAPAAFDANDLVSQLTKVFDERSANSNNEAMAVLFDQQLAQATTAQPGFQEYLDQTDDYGNVRRDNLTKMTDYKSKVETLSKLQSSFGEAAANTPGRKPVVNTREREIAKDITSKYDEIYTKWEAGEYSSEQEMAEAHALVMSEEAAALMGDNA